MSKYNNLGRALVGIRDLRGVAWLISRSKRTAVGGALMIWAALARPAADWLYWTGLHVTGWKLIGYTGALMFGGAGWSSSSRPSAPASR